MLPQGLSPSNYIEELSVASAIPLLQIALEAAGQMADMECPFEAVALVTSTHPEVQAEPNSLVGLPKLETLLLDHSGMFLNI